MTCQPFDTQRLGSRADLLTLAGRPLLVVPETPAKFTASNVLIAWKATRESRRAMLGRSRYRVYRQGKVRHAGHPYIAAR